ncbi:MAG: hypothetical protein IBJ03_09400 [Gemmatimonadaceae bacterium]|nr:hypothetical protein [Gemmatimonadaceae bacterium]
MSTQPSALARWPGLLAFELRYQALRFTFAATVLLLGLTPLAAVATGFGPAGDAVNGAYVITQTMALISLFAVFALPMLCVHAALRDDDHGMRSLIESRPISRGTVLCVRFIGVLTLVLVALAISYTVLAVAPFVLPVPADRLIGFRAEPYVRAFVLLALPNAVWCAALLFAVAASTRSTLATFVASIAIYAGYMVTAMMVDSPIMAGTRPPSPELLARSAVLDPFGLSAFFEQTRYLTPTERNTFAFALNGHFLQNRIIVGLFAVVCLAPLGWIDRRRSLGSTAPHKTSWWSGLRAATASRDATRSASRAMVSVEPVLGSAAWRHTMTAVAKLESRLLLRSWPLLALLVMWIPVIAIEADGQLKGGDYGTRVLASTAQLADAVPMALAMLGALCVLYFAAEVFGRERVQRVDGIRDATPAANTAILTGKTLALLTVPVLLTVTGYGTTVVMHLMHGGLPIEWGVLAAHMGASLLPLVVTTGMAAALQVLLGNRWLALVVGLAVVLFASQGSALGVEHPLWRFGAAPEIEWSDLSGFGTTLQSWLAFQWLWLLGTVVLLWIAAALWPRGEMLSLGARLRTAPRLMSQSLGAAGRAGLVACALLFVVAMAGMYWQTNILTSFVTSDEAIARRVQYEQQYRRLDGLPQPSVQHVEAHVVLEPSSQRATIRGRLHLVNNTTAAVDTLWLDFPNGLNAVVVGQQADAVASRESEALSPDMQRRGAQYVATEFLHDSTHGMIGVTLSSPLAPGDSMPLPYDLLIERGGIRAGGNAIDVVENGTLLHSSDFLPAMGYSRGRELRDSVQRAKHGLTGNPSPLLFPIAAEDSLRAWAHEHGQTPAWFTANVFIATAPDQVAHGPGKLVSQTTSANASHWHYQTTRPTSAAFVITSGRYAVYRDTVMTARGPTPVEVWHNPVHADPATRLLTITTRSLERLEQEFGAYPHDVLRIIEVARPHRFGAYAMPGNIYLTETRGVLSDAHTGDIDLLLRRVGHEVGHQWWGHAVNPLDTDGRLLLVETAAKYAEQVLLEGEQGQERLLDMLAVDEDRYLSSRYLQEATLLTMHDEPSLYYSKGTLAMYTLRHTLGDAVVRNVFRQILATEGGSKGAATARLFQQLMLEASTTPEARAAVQEWLGERVIYDLVADTATFAPAGSGTRITAQFSAKRVAVADTGAAAHEVITPLNGTVIEIGARDAAGVMHRFAAIARDGQVMVDTVLPSAIQSVEIDPRRFMIDRERSNNRATAPKP